MAGEYHILSLGAGVQSTMLALLSHRQDVPEYVPKFDAAIFADTQEEPREVYRHLNWLAAEVKKSFPIIIATNGRLGDDIINGDHNGRVASIPAFTTDIEGQPTGIIRRQCSSEYKTNVIDRTVKQQILGAAKRQRIKDVVVHYYIGLSAEEGQRVHGRNGRPGVKDRIESAPWRKAHFPLYDMFLNRKQILAWLEDKVPHVTPRSACSFCPFHSDKEWQHVKDTDPEGWARSIEIDEALRNGAAMARGLDQKLYLHKSCVPLRDVVLKPKEENDMQGELNFSVLECEGMCGL